MIERKINYISKLLNECKNKKNLDIDIIEDEYNSKDYIISYKIISEWYDEDEYIENIYELIKEFNKQYGDLKIKIETNKTPKETKDEIWLEAIIKINLM